MGYETREAARRMGEWHLEHMRSSSELELYVSLADLAEMRTPEWAQEHFGVGLYDRLQWSPVPISSEVERRCVSTGQGHGRERVVRCAHQATWHYHDLPICDDHARELRATGCIGYSYWIGETGEVNEERIPSFFRREPLQRVMQQAIERREWL